MGKQIEKPDILLK